MKPNQRIQSISTIFLWFFRLLFITLPLLSLYPWLKAQQIYSHAPTMITVNGQALTILAPLGIGTLSIACLISLIPLIAKLFILYFIIKLFKLYQQGNVFTRDNIMQFKYVSISLFISQLIHPIYQALFSFVMTSHNPIGHRHVVIGIGQDNITALIVASIILLVSWVMTEGHHLAEEQQYTV